MDAYHSVLIYLKEVSSIQGYGIHKFHILFYNIIAGTMHSGILIKGGVLNSVTQTSFKLPNVINS